jgi:hypothetical protein
MHKGAGSPVDDQQTYLVATPAAQLGGQAGAQLRRQGQRPLVKHGQPR